MRRAVIGASVIAAVVPACGGANPYQELPSTPALRAGPVIGWHVVGRVPHRSKAFVEGLVFLGPRLFESAGGYGESAVIELSPADGAVIRRVVWPQKLAGPDEAPFAEGLAVANGRLVQLSWRNERALTYDPARLDRGPDLPFKGEGWGLCSDGTALWRSDGTDQLHRHDPTTMVELGDPIAVRLGSTLIDSLNELECVDGHVLANVWHTPYVVRIDLPSGVVSGVLDFTRLIDEVDAPGFESVLNGLAYDPATGHLLVTGKRWSTMFVVALD